MAAFTRNENSFIVAMFGVFSSVVMLGIVRCFTKLWTWIGILLVMKTSRNNEYMADAFSCRGIHCACCFSILEMTIQKAYLPVLQAVIQRMRTESITF